MSPPIACICFDLDDTLWPVNVVITRAERVLHEWLLSYYPRLARRFSSRDLRKLREQLLLQHPHLACDFSTLRKMSLHHAAERVGYRPDFVEQALEIFLQARHDVTLYHDVLPTLQALHGRYRLSTLTNGNADVNRLSLSAWFDCNIQACQIGVAKPAVEPFHAICKMLAVSPEQVLHVGDDVTCDVQGAQNAGMQAIWLNRTREPWRSETPQPPTIHSLTELLPLLT
ncbi:HAD family hydrolase [Thioflexithrix psekupsensis]|uniref:HAD family hydrolase n=1 Tax=Thioflexithrix psekupsensis TaxID=1570016 RepID=A0A251XBN3_9GAMM|nr:HAD-IA family hydrolase [Thioflexithrix psekupsensis]OUD16061.1 hypothetical protein TPSD3_01255 [Thioflexithrix psekupsensis]